MAQDIPDLGHDVYRLLNKVFLLLDDCDRRFFAEHHLNARQFWALQHLDEEQGRSMVDLSRALLTDKSNVTAIVDRLEKDKWATRTLDAGDRRVFLITLTPEGRRVRDSVNAQHEARIRELLTAEGEERLLTLMDLLAPLSRRLEAYLAREEGSASALATVGSSAGTRGAPSSGSAIGAHGATDR